MPAKLPGLFLAFVALASAGCGGAVEGSAAAGAGGTGTSVAGGSGGRTTSIGAGGQGTGGQGTGGQGTSTGSGGAGGTGGVPACDGACVTSADCPLDQPVCSALADCNECFGPCSGAQCQGANTCVSDADCNASPDAKCVCDALGCTMCVLGFAGGPPGFPEALGEGVWLIGWSGGLDHYSWLRFTFQTATTGTFTLLDPVGVTLTPYFSCEGPGAFTVQLGVGVVVLAMPVACNMADVPLDFVSFWDPGGFPPHALKGAEILTTGGTIQGFQHDAGFCDAGFTVCGDPFLP